MKPYKIKVCQQPYYVVYVAVGTGAHVITNT